METNANPTPPIIFLDIDGVLLPFGDGVLEGSDFPDSCLVALSKILSATGARIVLSSTWRCDASAVEAIFANFVRFSSVHGGPLGEVKQLNDTTSLLNHTNRQSEINEWLLNHKELGAAPWIALDDEDLIGGSCNEDLRLDFAGHAVQTQSHVGLTSEDADVVVILLQKQQGCNLQQNELDVMSDIFPQVPKLVRDLSDEYQSSGASRYNDTILVEWRNHRDRASAAMRNHDWMVAASELRQGLQLRPEWVQGCLGLHAACMKIGDCVGADSALRNGFNACTASVRRTLEMGVQAQSCIDQWFVLAEKLEAIGSDIPCQAMGVTTRDDNGEVLTLYRDAFGTLLLDAAPSPLRLLFLDVDGVLNNQGAKECGTLLPELVACLQRTLEATSAVVVLSTSWRNFSSLRPLIVGAVIGQTVEGFQNHTRPCEIAAFLALPEVCHALAMPDAGWVVVDDMDLNAQAETLAWRDASMKSFVSELRGRFVRTDPAIGLNELAEHSIVNIFNTAT